MLLVNQLMVSSSVSQPGRRDREDVHNLLNVFPAPMRQPRSVSLLFTSVVRRMAPREVY